MINATEARVKSFEIRNDLKKQEKQMVKDVILQAVEKGELCCWINSNISFSLVEELREIGYHVEILETPFITPQVKISW